LDSVAGIVRSVTTSDFNRGLKVWKMFANSLFSDLRLLFDLFMSVKDQIIDISRQVRHPAVVGLIIFVCGLFLAGAVGRVVKKSLTRSSSSLPWAL
jgi:hypothetical protein